MNLSSHILVRMGLDKSQFDAGMRNIKHEMRGLKDIAKFGGMAGVIVGVVAGFQSIASAGADAVAKLSMAWSDRFRAMSSAIDETKGGLSGLVAYLAWIAALPVTFLTRFQGAMSGGAGIVKSAQIAWDTGLEEREKRVARAEAEYRAARREASMEFMDPEQRKQMLLGELDVLLAQRDAMKDREAIAKKSTEIEKKFKEVKDAQDKLAAEQAKKEADSLKETAELEERRAATKWKAVDAQRQMNKLEQDGIDAQRAYGAAIEDRSGLTLEDYINTQPVNRETFDNRRKAMDIRAIEQRSKWARWFGDEEWANSDTLAALNLRKSLPGLTSSERDPMQSIRDSSEKSQEHLRQLLDDERAGRFNVQIKNTP